MRSRNLLQPGTSASEVTELPRVQVPCWVWHHLVARTFYYSVSTAPWSNIGMKGLLSNAVYTSHYAPKKPVQLSQWEQLQQILQRFLDDHDVIPLAGTTAGLMVGGSVIILFLSLWYWWLCRRRRLRNSSKSEYVNLLSMVSRATSDDSHYNQRRKRSPTSSSKKQPSLWSLLLKKTRRTEDNPLPKISGPACYLLYEPDNGGQLIQYYSAIPLDLQTSTSKSERTIVAVWKPASHISSHKYTENAGRTVLSTNSTLGFQGKHNYCQGICKFVQSAFPCGGGSLTLLPDPPIAADVYLYLNDSRPQYQTIALEVGKTATLPSNSLAVATVPKGTSFYKNKLVDMYQWLEDGERQGSSIRF